MVKEDFSKTYARDSALPKTENEWVEILRRAARAGASAIERNYTQSSRTRVTKKGAGGDLTLEIDELSESAIYDSLSKDLGQNSFIFVSEEMGEVKSSHNAEDSKPIILCDPLDGSHNAQVGLPLYSISLSVFGLQRKIRRGDKRRFGDVDVGLVFNIPAKEEFYAIKGMGTFHNGSNLPGKLKTKSAEEQKDDRFSTIGIECSDVDYLKKVLSNLSSNSVYKLRVLGSAAISYCLLADGTFDGFLFVQPNGARTIDSPAGYLIAKEARRFFADLSAEVKDVDRVEVAFESRINLIGARDQEILLKLRRILGKIGFSARKRKLQTTLARSGYLGKSKSKFSKRINS
jgi:myo-inositol-1(or 4)-monophosphatase